MFTAIVNANSADNPSHQTKELPRSQLSNALSSIPPSATPIRIVLTSCKHISFLEGSSAMRGEWHEPWSGVSLPPPHGRRWLGSLAGSGPLRASLVFERPNDARNQAKTSPTTRSTARGFVFPGVGVSNATSNVVLDALQSIYGTGANAAAVGRAVSSASVAIGSTMEASSAIQGGLISEAEGAGVNSGQAPQK